MELKPIIISALIILIGCVLVGVIANINSANVNRQIQTNEDVTLSTTANYTFVGKNIASLLVFNYTNGTIKQNYNFTVDLTNGIIALNDTTWKGANNLWANYTFEDRTYYINDSTSRSLMILVPLMFVLSILVVVIYYATDGFNDLDFK